MESKIRVERASRAFVPRSETGAQAVAARAENHGIRVVLIEDDELICGGLAALLTMEGYDVHSTGSGLGAEALIERVNPSVVLADLSLPDCDGVELVATIRTRWPSIRVVVSTGRLDKRLEPAGIAVLLKPYGIDELLTLIRS